MNRADVSITIAIVAGFAAVFVLPPPWLEQVVIADTVCVAIFAIIVRLNTKTAPPANPVAGALLSILNLPEKPLAKINEGWALTTFRVSAAFLISLALAVIVRAYS